MNFCARIRNNSYCTLYRSVCRIQGSKDSNEKNKYANQETLTGTKSTLIIVIIIIIKNQGNKSLFSKRNPE